MAWASFNCPHFICHWFTLKTLVKVLINGFAFLDLFVVLVSCEVVYILGYFQYFTNKTNRDGGEEFFAIISMC